MGWINRWFGRRRHALPLAPPTPDPDRLSQAVAEAQRADSILKRVQGHDQRVTETSDRATQALRQNHLGPSFWAWAESLGDNPKGRTP